MCTPELLLQLASKLWWRRDGEDADAPPLLPPAPALKPPLAPVASRWPVSAVRAAAMTQCGEYGACPVCMDDMADGAVVYLTCQTYDPRRAATDAPGPVHALCGACWAATVRARLGRCPLCQQGGVRGLDAEAYARWCLGGGGALRDQHALSPMRVGG